MIPPGGSETVTFLLTWHFPTPNRAQLGFLRDIKTLQRHYAKFADAATVARWYYWRWRIESYHKLLKGAGQQVEQWQQESAAALARRLLVAAMAWTAAWAISTG